MNKTIESILNNYQTESVAIQQKLYNMLMSGKLAGTGRMIILPVDQGFEHGPDRSFAKNPASYDPDYHIELAIEAGLTAYAAPLGFLSACKPQNLVQIPTILKINSSNSLIPKAVAPNQSINGSIEDAVRLGCSAIGLTIYPGSSNSYEMFEEARELVKEARSYGLMSVIWSYPRGEDLSKEGETAIDVCAYAAHIAALLGAHIIKVKPPTSHIEQVEARKVFESQKIDVASLASCIAHVRKACFAGKRLVVFSGGATKSTDELIAEIESLKQGGASGSIIGRNVFQRPRNEALSLLNRISDIYKAI